MADDRKITIEILGGGKEKTKSEQDREEEKNPYKEFQESLTKWLHPIKTAESAIVAKSVILGQAIRGAKQAVTQSVELGISRRLTLKEDYLGENVYNQIKTKISKTTGLFGSAAAGAIAGAKLGPIGAAVGAGLGTVFYSISQVVGYQGKLSSFYQQLNATNYQTGFMSQKAGLIVGTQNTLG